MELSEIAFFNVSKKPSGIGLPSDYREHNITYKVLHTDNVRSIGGICHEIVGNPEETPIY